MSCATMFPTLPGGLILCDTDAKFDLNRILYKLEEKIVAKMLNPKNAIKTAEEFFTNPTKINFSRYVKNCIPYYAKNHYTSSALTSDPVQNFEVIKHYVRNDLYTYNFLPSLNRIATKTLIICGQDSPVHTKESAHQTALAISKEFSKLAVFEGCGTPVYNDNPIGVLKCIFSFIDEVLYKPISTTKQPFVCKL